MIKRKQDFIKVLEGALDGERLGWSVGFIEGVKDGPKENMIKLKWLFDIDDKRW